MADAEREMKYRRIDLIAVIREHEISKMACATAQLAD
jgi:hypothetical protein